MAAVAALAGIVAGCGSSDHSGKADTSTAIPTSSSVAATPADEVPIANAVTDAYTRFFDYRTPAAEKITLVENGPNFAPTINAQVNSPMSRGTTVQVLAVKHITAVTADVTYSIFLNGSPALPNQQGSSVKQDGTWKVSAYTFCGLLNLEGTHPPACGAPAS